MKVAKLLENITKGKLESDTKIKLNTGIEIIYKYDDSSQRYYFEDNSGKEINIMDYYYVILNRLKKK